MILSSSSSMIPSACFSLSPSAVRSGMSAPRPLPRATFCMTDDLLRKLKVALRAPGPDVIEERRFAVARRLAQRHVPVDDGCVHLVLEVLAHFIRHLFRKIVPAVIHGEKHAFYDESRIQVLFDKLDGVHESGQALERVILALNRDQHAVGRGQRVNGKQSERRRAVNEDVFIIIANALNRFLEYPLPGDHLDELYFNSHQVYPGGNHLKPGEMS